jgi:hypothetical protein
MKAHSAKKKSIPKGPAEVRAARIICEKRPRKSHSGNGKHLCKPAPALSEEEFSPKSRSERTRTLILAAVRVWELKHRLRDY